MTEPRAQFIDWSTHAGAVVAESGGDAAAALAALLKREQIARLALSSEIDGAAPWVTDVATAAGVEVRLVREREDILWADAGLSIAALAIAETGTVLPRATTRLDRLVGMLPLVHIVLVPAEVLVETLDDAAAFLRREAAPARYLSFVTGPSRTGDIEMVLTVGVHGPSRFCLLLLDPVTATGQQAVTISARISS